VTGTINNAIGVKVTDSTLTGQTLNYQAGVWISGFAAATNNTGLLMGQSTIPSGNFGIYNASTNNNYFAGNVGIGTATPSTKLEVAGAMRLSTTAVDTYATPVGSNVPTKINVPSYDPGAFGQVVSMGILSTSQATSRVISLFDARTVDHQPTLTVFSPNENQVLGLTWDGSNAVGSLKSSADISLKAGSTEVVRALASNGNVGIGTTGPTSLLHVNGAALATAWNTSSDIRLKENVKEIENPLDKILQLRGVEFDWRADVKAPTKHDQPHDIGVIAQEVEKVFPEAVTTPEKGYKSVAYSKLIAPVIEAVKALYARLTGVEADVAQLKARADKAEAENAALKADVEMLKARLIQLEQSIPTK
jgi:hypothetical protein